MSPAVIFICLAASIVFAWLSVTVFNRVPAKWLCDYGEQPGEELFGRRLSLFPHGLGIAVIYAVSFFALYLQFPGDPRFFAGCAAAVLLMLTAVADLKYRIIPDQFVLLILLPELGFFLYDFLVGHEFFPNWYSPVLGALSGAALMLLMNLLGRALFRKDSLGFGDVKLFAAAGIFTGFPFVFLLFFLTILLAFFHILILTVTRKMTDDHYLPFGPYICLALLLFLAFHSQITGFAAWYLSLLNL